MIKHTRRWIYKRTADELTFLLSLLLLLSSIPTSAAPTQAPASPRLITAAVLNDFPPLYSHDEAGKPNGFAIDILEQVAKQIGLKVRYLPLENWAKAMQAIRSGAADLIPGIGISPARSAEFLFTEEIETIPVSCFVRSSNNDIKGIESLPDHRVAVIGMSAAHTRLRPMQGIDLVAFPNIDSALFQLMAGDVDAFVFPEPVLKKKMRLMNIGIDHIKVVGKPLMELKRGFLLRKADTRLVEQLNPAISAYTQSKQYLADQQKWYGNPTPFWTVHRMFWAMSGLLVLLLVTLVAWRFFTLKGLNARLIESMEERERAEQAQGRERSLLTSLLDSIPDLIFYKDPDSIYLGCNRAFEDFVGHKESELAGHTDLEFFPQELAEFFREKDRRMLASGKAQRNEEWVDYPDGRRILLDTLKTPYYGPEGKLQGLIGISRDITERMQAQHHAQKMDAMYKNLAENIPGAAYRCLIDEDWTMKYISRNIEALSGFPPGDFIDNRVRSYTSIIHPDDVDMVAREIHAAIATKRSFLLEYRIIHADGEIRWIWERGRACDDGEGPAFHLEGVMDDITKRKQGEQDLRRTQKMDAIGQITGGIAHDFNNLLGIIIGNLDFLRCLVSKDDKSLRRVESASKAALRASDLTRQLLGFSRRQSQETHPTDINRVILGMDSLIARSVTPEVEVDLQLADKPWLTRIDSGDLEDALLNLILNARDAMPQGGRLTIETANQRLDSAYNEVNPEITPGDYLQLAVSDSGYGIPKEMLEQIFEPFFTTKPADKGTGLGLSMVYGFAQRSSGYVKIYSEPGIGTTVRLYLPRSADRRKETRDVIHTDATSLQGHETIMVVDDEPDLLDLAKDYLEEVGYRVHTAARASEALAALQTGERIDLLFSDVVMPGGMNGYDLAEQACERNPDLKVLLTSGFTKKAAARNGQAHFAANLLSKPYVRDNLIKRIRDVLDADKG